MTAAAIVDDAYWGALREGDTASAVAIANRFVARGADLLEVLEGLVCAAQAEVGRRWAANEWSVAEEHRATSVSEDVISSLAAGVAGSGERGTAVVTCVDGEWHSLPARVVAVALRRDGWRVHYLGASVPAEHLAGLVHDLGPDVVALSCQVATSLPRARRMIEAARDAGVPVLAGGAGFGPGGRWALALGADGVADDARGAAVTLAAPGWPRFTEPAPPPPEADGASALIAAARDRLVGEARGHLGPVSADAGADDLGYLVDFLAASLLVADPELWTSSVRWLEEVLDARSVPRSRLAGELRAIGEALDPSWPPRVAGLIDRAAATLPPA